MPTANGTRRGDEHRGAGGADDPLVVGVGASAGGLDACRRLLQAAPEDGGLAFVLVLHLDPDRESQMAPLLDRRTALPVVEAEDGDAVEAGRAYVIPPGRELRLEDGALRLEAPTARRGQRAPIDAFLGSLARARGRQAVGVLLSGTGTDGLRGLREIREAGGLTLAQEPASAEFDGMPGAAIEARLADLVLPPEEMGPLLARYRRHAYVDGGAGGAPAGEAGGEDALAAVLERLREVTGRDLRHYKAGTLARRVHRRMGLRQVGDLGGYLRLLDEDGEEAHALLRDLLIGVTSFFRDAEAWDALRRKAIHRLVAEAEPGAARRIWVPACASGEEPYSVAMLLHDAVRAADRQVDVQVFATDLDGLAVATARRAQYPAASAADVPRRLRERYLGPAARDGFIEVARGVRDLVTFAQQDLIHDPPFSRIDLLVCRNLLIYLEPEAQARVLRLLHFALRPGGYLFLGRSEGPRERTELFRPVDSAARLYRRVGEARGRAPALERAPHTIAAPPDPFVLPPVPAIPGRGVADVAREALLRHATPPAVVVDHNHRALYYSGDTGRYLRQPHGPPTDDLLEQIPEGLRHPVRLAVRRALADGEVVTRAGLSLEAAGERRAVRVCVRPVDHPEADEPLALVVFDDERGPAEAPPPALPLEGELIGQLEQELRDTREDLRLHVQQLETSNEELQTAHEEVLSTNQELRYTNEELEASREELQSLNEELTTVNAELQAKVEELEEANHDLANLLTSTDVAAVFLDPALRIRRFTPAMTALLPLRPADRGRPLADFGRPVVDGTLLQQAGEVRDGAAEVRDEVALDGDRWFVRRVLPYHAGAERVAGVVVTFADITALKRSERALQRLNDDLDRRVRERSRLLAMTHDVALVANEAARPEQALRRALERVCSETAWSVGHAFLRGEAGGEPVLVESGVWWAADSRRRERLEAATGPLEFEPGDGLVGALLASGEPVAVPDLTAADGFLRRDAALADGLRAYAAFPIPVGRRVAGALEFFHTERLEPDDDLWRAMDQVVTLLGRVLEREEASREVARISEIEQRRMGRELHDDIAQRLAGTKMIARGLQARLEQERSAAAGRAADLREHLDGTLARVRDLSRGLMPVAVEPGSLPGALRTLAETVSRLYDLPCHAAVGDPPPLRDADRATHLYRIAREALINAAKHARATSLRLELSRHDAGAVLEVRDDGEGFDPAAVDGEGFGLTLMRQRAHALGGTLELVGGRDGGTTVRCFVPLGPDREAGLRPR